MKKQIIIFTLLLRIGLTRSCDTVYNAPAFVNIDIIKKDSLYVIDLKKKFRIAVKDIQIQRHLYDDAIETLNKEFNDKKISSEEFQKQIKDISFNRSNLNVKLHHLRQMFDELVEEKVIEYAKVIAEKDKFSAVLPIELCFVCYPLFDITYRILNKMNVDWVNEVEDRLDNNDK